MHLPSCWQAGKGYLLLEVRLLGADGVTLTFSETNIQPVRLWLLSHGREKGMGSFGRKNTLIYLVNRETSRLDFQARTGDRRTKHRNPFNSSSHTVLTFDSNCFASSLIKGGFSV